MPDYIQVGALIIECDGSVRVVASLLDVAVNSCMCMGSIHLHSLEMCVHHIKLDRANNQALVLQHHLTACAVLGGRPMGFHVVAVCSYTRHFTTPLASTLHVTDTAQANLLLCWVLLWDHNSTFALFSRVCKSNVSQVNASGLEKK